MKPVSRRAFWLAAGFLLLTDGAWELAGAQQQLELPGGDIVAPTIHHDPLADTRYATGSTVVSARVVDDAEVSAVTLFYRFAPGVYTRIAMERVGPGDLYSASIAAPGPADSPVEYYIQAADAAGNTVLKGLAFAPLSVPAASTPAAAPASSSAVLPPRAPPTAASTAAPAVEWPAFQAGLRPGRSSSRLRAALPEGVRIERPAVGVDPSRASLSGLWQGWMCRNGVYDALLAVVSVDEAGATVVFAGASQDRGVQPFSARLSAVFVGDQLLAQASDGTSYAYRLRPDGHLDARWAQAAAWCTGVLERVSMR